MPKKASPTYNLKVSNPKLAKEWHPTKNGDLKPTDVTHGSHRKVWWKCPKGDDHEWQAKIVNRAYLNRNCPFCSGHKVVFSNSLQAVYPLIAVELHPLKNGI